MSEKDINKYKAAWKSESGFENRNLSKDEIQDFLRSSSADINTLFRRSIIIDIILKFIIGISFIVLLFLFDGNIKITVFNSIAILIVIVTAIFQFKTLDKIPKPYYGTENLRAILESEINYYRKSYFKSAYINALSVFLFIISGNIFYFYYKYGEIRALDMEDYFVFGIIALIGFSLAAYVQRKQYSFRIKQLEKTLEEIDENTISPITIKKQYHRKNLIFLALILAVVCGILIFSFIAFK
ncbi:MAG: hypothetical protein ABFR62_09155 [Bacteroidota bacterium]